VHFHVWALDGVFSEVAGEGEVDADVQPSPPSVTYHPASSIDAAAVAQVQTDLGRHILRAFVGRDLQESCDGKEMLAYKHSGFLVDAGVCIEAHDRAAMDRLRKECAAVVYRRAHTGQSGRGADRASHHGHGH
jgi:hypothetical protein